MRTGERVMLNAAGFTPATNLLLRIDGRYVGWVRADPAGAVSYGVALPTLRGTRVHTLEATDQLNPAIRAATRFMGTGVTVRVRPRSGPTRVPRRVIATGFTTGRRLYVHYVRGSYRRTVAVGAVRGACGRLSVRRRLVPPGARSGRYTVRFDTRRATRPAPG